MVYSSQDLSIEQQARRNVLAFEKEINRAFQESLEITAINQFRKARHIRRGQNEHVAKLSTAQAKFPQVSPLDQAKKRKHITLILVQLISTYA